MQVETVREDPAGGFIVNGDPWVPDDPASADYQSIQTWIAAGNVVEAAEQSGEFTISDAGVLLTALETKVGITKADLAVARAARLNKGGL